MIFTTEYVVWDWGQLFDEFEWLPGAVLHREGGPVRTVVRTHPGTEG